MEVRVYLNMQSYSADKPHYCVRVECPEVFDFGKTLDVFRSLYGAGCIVVFFCP